MTHDQGLARSTSKRASPACTNAPAGRSKRRLSDMTDLSQTPEKYVSDEPRLNIRPSKGKERESMVHKDERPDRKDRSVHPEDMQMLADTQMAGSGTSVKELDSEFHYNAGGFPSSGGETRGAHTLRKSQSKKTIDRASNRDASPSAQRPNTLDDTDPDQTRKAPRLPLMSSSLESSDEVFRAGSSSLHALAVAASTASIQDASRKHFFEASGDVILPQPEASSSTPTTMDMSAGSDSPKRRLISKSNTPIACAPCKK